MSSLMTELIAAIRDRKRVRLAYERKSDGVLSIHEIAPIDLRPGETKATSRSVYLWAWCFAEMELEMHIVDRIKRVTVLDETFSPAAVLSHWPKAKWPIPNEWLVPRDW